jgi:diguanylate cyclase (GGDEF)-like protein
VRTLLADPGRLRSVFQPIVSLVDGQVAGYEALLRLPAECGFPGAAEAFAAAAATEALVDLELAALESHLRSARGLASGRLFLNLSARAFADARMRNGRLGRLVRAFGFEPRRIVLELTELVHIDDLAALAAAIACQREHGFLLAVDDFGAGFTNLLILVELGPDYLKIDRSLVAGAASHPRRRSFLESIGSLGRRINCSIVAEGVETDEDLAAVRACGIEHAQGWALARPGPVPEPPPLPTLLRPRATTEDLPAEGVGAIAHPEDGFGPETRSGDVVRLFERHGEVLAVPVLQGLRAVGLLTRARLFRELGSRYGFAVWHDRPVRDLVLAMGEGFDSLPSTASPEAAVELVRRRPPARRFDPLVIETERGDYHGLLHVDVLLGEVSRLKVEYARQSHPLTGLPGSLAFERVIQGRLATGQPFSLAWVDIDDFKPFNDRYGFSRGDEVLTLLAGLLRERLADRSATFLSHPGGDDFAFVAAADEGPALAREVVEEFSERVPALYDPADRLAGGIQSVDRQGNTRHFGLLSVSVGLVVWRGEAGLDYPRLVEAAAEVKAHAKRTPGPAVVINGRDLLSGPWLPSRPA